MDVLEGEIVTQPFQQPLHQPLAIDLYNQLPTEVRQRPGVFERVQALDMDGLEALADTYRISVGSAGCTTYSVAPHIAPTIQPHFEPRIEFNPVILVDAKSDSNAHQQGSDDNIGRYWPCALFVAILLALAAP